MKNRKSNFELLRIIAMFLIVLYHVIFHGNVIKFTTGKLQLTFEFIKFFTMVHVNIFILIMGYFQSKSEFKIKKVFSILLQVWFYNILVNGLLKYFKIVEYTNIGFINSISPFNLNSYWFVYCYLIMYMLSPFINMIIDKADKVTLKKAIILLICIFGVVPYVTLGLAWNYNIYSVEQFILMYFIGAYIRKYEIDKKVFSNLNTSQKRVSCLLLFAFGVLINFALCLAQRSLKGAESNILQFLAQNILTFVNSYSNPILIIESIAIFILFSTFDFESKFINYLSGLTLGVYLIHDGWNIRYSIYKLLKIDKGGIVFGRIQIVHVFMAAIIIFIIGMLVEFIRQTITKYICKIKFISNFNNKFIRTVENLIEVKN